MVRTFIYHFLNHHGTSRTYHGAGCRKGKQKSAVSGYKALEQPGTRHIHGWFAILGCYLLMMYYTTVSGWMVSYFFKFAAGTFHQGMNAESSGSVFTTLLSNPLEMGIWWPWSFLPDSLCVAAGFKMVWKGSAKA